MLDTLMSFLAPHRCCGCGELPTLLCNNCKYYITSEPYVACVSCGNILAGSSGICKDCKVPYQRAWCVAERREQLQRLIGNYKFTNAHAAYKPLTDLIHDRLPELPPNVTVVPIPTVSSHIRQRGYDHMLLIAKRLGKLRNIPVDTNLQRITNTKQRDASARQRKEQAKVAFQCRASLDADRIYLLIDDVITTGVTVKYATQALLDAGASTVWVATISRQPLD